MNFLVSVITFCFVHSIGAVEIYKSYLTSLVKSGANSDFIALDVYRNFGLKSALQLPDDVLEICGTSYNNVAEDIKSSISRIKKDRLSFSSKILGESYSSKQRLIINTAIQTGNSRSTIYDCVKTADNQLFVNLKLKLTKDLSRFRNEMSIYSQIKQRNTNIVSIFGFEESVKGTDSAILMESGGINLKQALAYTGPIRGANLKRIAKSMAKSVSIFHSKNLCWTDVKLENFVLFPEDNKVLADLVPFLNLQQARKGDRISKESLMDVVQLFVSGGNCKAIDFESALAPFSTLKDFSPEIVAPEQVDFLTSGQLVAGRGEFTLNISKGSSLLASQSADIWGLGICILHLYSGQAPIVEGLDVRGAFLKVKAYVDNQDTMGIDKVDDVLLKRLLKSMLSLNAKKRPSISNVLSSLYFLRI